MKEIILISLTCTGLVTTTPLMATGITLQGSSQEATPLLAQYRQNYYRRYAVYYRNPRYGRWMLAGSHSYLRDAKRAERRLQRLGYLTYVRFR